MTNRSDSKALFDAAWYLREYPDVAKSGLDPWIHYQRYGRPLRRLPAEGLPPESYPGLPPEPAADHERMQDHHDMVVDLYPRPVFEPDSKHASQPPAGALPIDTEAAVRLPRTPDLAVHLHIHHAELLRPCLERLRYLPERFQLYLSLTRTDLVKPAKRLIAELLPTSGLVLKVVPNRGRDLGPMVTSFASSISQHELILHIHSKRSTHSANKRDWLEQLISHLLPSPAGVQGIIGQFLRNARLGLLHPVYQQSLAWSLSWGTNFGVSQQLGRKLGLSLAPERLILFPAGSMFWARCAALKPLWQLGLTAHDFPAEAAQLDGTPAHAIERLIGALVDKNGYTQQQIWAPPRESDAGTG